MSMTSDYFCSQKSLNIDILPSGVYELYLHIHHSTNGAHFTSQITACVSQRCSGRSRAQLLLLLTHTILIMASCWHCFKVIRLADNCIFQWIGYLHRLASLITLSYKIGLKRFKRYGLHPDLQWGEKMRTFAWLICHWWVNYNFQKRINGFVHFPGR